MLFFDVITDDNYAIEKFTKTNCISQNDNLIFFLSRDLGQWMHRRVCKFKFSKNTVTVYYTVVIPIWTAKPE